MNILSGISKEQKNKLYTTGIRSIQLLSFIIISDYLYQSYIRISVCAHRIINSVGCIAVDEKIDNVAAIVIYYLCYYHAVARPAVNYILDNITGLCGENITVCFGYDAFARILVAVFVKIFRTRPRPRPSRRKLGKVAFIVKPFPLLTAAPVHRYPRSKQ